jgi:hypothetical protein
VRCARAGTAGSSAGPASGSTPSTSSLFATRLHRALTAAERKALAARAAQNPGKTQQQALALESEALAAWLLGPETMKKAPARKAARSARA